MTKTIDLYKAFNWLLALLLFSLPVSEALKQVFIYPLILLGLVMIFKYKLKPSYNALFISILAYFAIYFLSAAVNLQTNYILDYTRCGLLFIILACIEKDKIDIEKNIIALFIGYVVAFVIGEYELIIQKDIYFKLKSIGHVNAGAIYSFLILIIAICVFKYRKINKYFNIFIIILSFSGIMLAGARTCIYVLPLLWIFGAIFIFNIKFKLKHILSTLGVGVFFILITSLLTQLPYNRINNKISQGIATGSISDDVSNRETRLPIWGAAFQVWAKNPFFGIGDGNFKDINISTYYPDTTEPSRAHAHNMPINLLVNNGIFVVLAYIALQFIAFVSFLRYYKTSAIISSSIFMIVFVNIFSITELMFYNEFLILLLTFFAISLVEIKELKKIKAQ